MYSTECFSKKWGHPLTTVPATRTGIARFFEKTTTWFVPAGRACIKTVVVVDVVAVVIVFVVHLGAWSLKIAKER